MAKTGVIYGINGPVVSLLGDSGFQMNEMVHVGQEKLVGEVIRPPFRFMRRPAELSREKP